VYKVKRIPPSGSGTKCRYLDVSEYLLKQFLDKLKKAQSFGFQLDEATDISDELQLILYCRFAEKGNKRHCPDVLSERWSLLKCSSHLR